MTPEITDPRFQKIADDIKNDPENASFTKRGIAMDFYFPGTGKSGDLAPRKDFADTWHPRLLELMPKLEMTILVGAYATRRYLGLKSSASLTDVVRDYKRYLPTYFPLVHPSPRNQIWMKKNPWFDADVLPDLKKRVAELMA